jgi:TRAP transporter TAXI family solute receptor
MITTARAARRRKLLLWGILIGLSVAVVLVSFTLTEPPPPHKIRMATGVAHGGYDQFGHKYQQRLAARGLTVELVNSNGAVDNLQKLLRGEVDVAFCQGGTQTLVQDPDKKLRAIAAIYLEPLWVFYAVRDPKEPLVDTLTAFEGKRLSIGPSRSGTEAISRSLLEKHDIDKKSTLVNSSAPDASKALAAGKLDVAMVVGSYKDAGVEGLLRQDKVRLMNFKREIAYSRTFPYLTPVKVAEGLLDLSKDIPPQDTVLLAPAAMLVCREDLHPGVVEQILKTAQLVHQQQGDLLEGPKPFPTLEGVDLPVHDAAETFMKSGESFLSRVLPYWAMRLLVQLKIFLLPLLVLWLPAFKLLPALYQMRINTLLKRHYTELREAETHIVHAETVEELRQRIAELDKLRKDMERISRKVPGLYQRDVYHWRLHLSLVRNEALERLKRLQEGHSAEHALPPAARSVSA